jgi:hypothetical protein
MKDEPNPHRVGIYMDVLEKIIHELKAHPDLREMFGPEVTPAMVLVADDNDLRIEEGGKIPLSPEQVQTLLRVLDEVIQNNAV